MKRLLKTTINALAAAALLCSTAYAGPTKSLSKHYAEAFPPPIAKDPGPVATDGEKAFVIMQWGKERCSYEINVAALSKPEVIEAAEAASAGGEPAEHIAAFANWFDETAQNFGMRTVCRLLYEQRRDLFQ